MHSLAHDDLAPFEQIKIEGVRRMSHLHQDIIGYVGDVVDALMALNQQALRDVLWRLLDANVAYGTRRVTSAERWLQNLDGKRLRLNQLRKLQRNRL